MFDDPKKELRRMQQELLAVEHQEEPPAQEEDWLREAKDLLGPEEEEVPIRNFANDYGLRPPRNQAADFARTVYADEGFDEDAAVPDDRPKPKGAGGLIVLALLEVAGILAVVLWWARWLN